MVHAHATTYAWAWTTDDSTDAFNVVNAIATTYAVDATSALEAERAINDAKDAMGTSFTDTHPQSVPTGGSRSTRPRQRWRVSQRVEAPPTSLLDVLVLLVRKNHHPRP